MVSSPTLRAPVARKDPKILTDHGEERVDEYYWMRDRSNPGVIEYLEAENRYASGMMKHTEQLQKKLVEELKSRVAERDVSVFERIDDFYYYTRTEPDRQYPIYCRRKGSPNAPEEVILDQNLVAEGNRFYRVDLVKQSPDHNILMYLTDSEGSERHTLFLKDLSTGRLLEDRITNVHDAEWAEDNRTIFYSTMDREYRPDKVWRHVVGTDTKADVIVLHEQDAGFYYLEISRTKSRKFILITLESATTSEVHLLPSDRPHEGFKVLQPRIHGVTYFVDHFDGRFIIVTNKDAVNYKIMEADEEGLAEEKWRTLLPHREDVAIDVSDPHAWVEPFKGHLVVFERTDCQGRVVVYRLKDMRPTTIGFEEDIYFVSPMPARDPTVNSVRIRYWSLVTQTTVYDYDLETKELKRVKREAVPGYDPTKYVATKIHATAADGTKVPITLVHKKGLKKDGGNPCYLYGYGAYGTFEWASSKFNTNLLSLLERGFVCANAHIRGGADMGRNWHHQGRLLTKMNTFTDFIACAEELVAQGYTSPDKLVVRGRSAGGLLMGAVTNMRSDLFKVVIAEVPFVDGITTMLDPTIPMTVGEFEEWGNPAERVFYDYIKQYSPYDNVRRMAYPNMLVTAGWNDSRVGYWEPAKWVARLRAMRTDDNLMLFRTGIVEGHAGASGRFDYLNWFAFMYAFILDRLGIEG